MHGEITPDERERRIQKHRDGVAHQVQRYIEHVWPHLERPGGFSDTPVRFRLRADSNPPIPEGAHALLDVNRRFGDLIRRDLEDLEASDRTYLFDDGRKVEFRSLLRELRYDPGSVTKWRTGKTAEDRAKVAALWKLCQIVAILLLKRDPFLTPDEIMGRDLGG